MLGCFFFLSFFVLPAGVGDTITGREQRDGGGKLRTARHTQTHAGVKGVTKQPVHVNTHKKLTGWMMHSAVAPFAPCAVLLAETFLSRLAIYSYID